MIRNSPLTLVGVAGFEPAASSSRTTAEPQVTDSTSGLTWLFSSQHPSAHRTAISASDAPVTHADAGGAPLWHARNQISTA